MKTRTLRIVSTLVGLFFLSNCANQRQGSTLLPVMGAGLGAAIGSALLKDDKEMGLALGAVAGYGAGKLAENRKAKKQLELYNDGYKKGQSDSVKTLYWAQRNAERAEEPPPLEYRYYEVPVAKHITSDGVVVDAHRKIIEVVE
ncbi:MAG: hypothetical protein KDM91_11045 [Verrucomicrobiae bacterium]|nr:hypothetical protein [Verrucomicrobiae bacterium]MCP5541207.1 hypothetical protein [Akkermansiaceae bacterium]MCP5551649.1 hypothetical protein [Akkermansiaceae bacterium]